MSASSSRRGFMAESNPGPNQANRGDSAWNGLPRRRPADSVQWFPGWYDPGGAECYEDSRRLRVNVWQRRDVDNADGRAWRCRQVALHFGRPGRWLWEKLADWDRRPETTRTAVSRRASTGEAVPAASATTRFADLCFPCRDAPRGRCAEYQCRST